MENNTENKIIRSNRGEEIIVCKRFYDLFKFMRVSVSKGGYPRIRKFINYIDSSILLHHLVIGKPPKGMVVDHINQNKLDNRRCNLRFATKSQNAFNTVKKRKNKTGYRGVYQDSKVKQKTFDAYITVNGKRFWRSGFKTSIEAAIARDEMFREHFGDCGSLNFPDNN